MLASLEKELNVAEYEMEINSERFWDVWVADGVVVDIMSWARGCTGPRFPGVYANEINLRDYISEVTGH